MNQEERDWLDWLKRAKDGTVTQKVASEKMGVSERWVRALLVEMKTKGDGVVIHGLRGRASNRRIDDKIQQDTMKILKLPGTLSIFSPTVSVIGATSPSVGTSTSRSESLPNRRPSVAETLLLPGGTKNSSPTESRAATPTRRTRCATRSRHFSTPGYPRATSA